MEIKIRKLVELIGSGWLFVFTLILFIAETSWLALTSRFPMAFDEAYHFGLIQFFSHRLNPIVTQQPSSTYKFGALVQDPSFLYHYLMSFPYRFIVLFTKSLEIQVIDLRFINIALAVVSLIILRKLLQAINLPAGLTNVLLFAFALTPIVTLLSAQINYDNLLIPLVSLCTYQTVLFAQKLDSKVFDTKRLLILLCLCLFTSLVMFSFLPIFVVIVGILIWKINTYRRHLKTSSLVIKVRKDFASLGTYSKLLLLTFSLIGGFLFVRVYAVNLVEYHNPVPQCNQVLNIQDCKQYYAWDINYNLKQSNKIHPNANSMTTPHYTAYWSLLSTLDLFGAIMPLYGLYYVSPAFAALIGILGAMMLICTIVNFKEMLQKNQGLLIMTLISFIYMLSLWARNYHDFLQFGQPVAIDGRYLVPILIYLYALLGLGLNYTLNSLHLHTVAVKAVLALIIVFSFAYCGGYMQYISHISPVYGGLSPSNSFTL